VGAIVSAALSVVLYKKYYAVRQQEEAASRDAHARLREEEEARRREEEETRRREEEEARRRDGGRTAVEMRFRDLILEAHRILEKEVEGSSNDAVGKQLRHIFFRLGEIFFPFFYFS
jgi:predicted Holliday junction resolvase-like endonuclease